MDHFERVEAMMEAMDREPDRVFHELYYIFVFHGCAALAAMGDAESGKLADAVGVACVTILCPPVTVNVLGGEIYLLVQQNPHRSVQDTADAAGSPLPRWSGDYSCVSLCAENVEAVTAAINDGSIRALLASWHDEE